MKCTLTLFIAGLLLLSQATQAQEMRINTIAGTGIVGFNGDGGAATNAQLDGPRSVAVDRAGNVYFVDFYNLRVRKISVDGTITTVAGNGTTGSYTSDTTLATSIPIDPEGVAVDKYGNLYITDNENVIRKVDAAGIIYRIGGLGSPGYSGDGGLAIHATINAPRGIAVDTSGNIYFAEAYNSVVRKINTAGIISTVAGNDSVGCYGDGHPADSAWLDSPSSVAVDYVGDLFITDYKNNVIRKVDINGIISVYAGSYLTGSVTCTPEYGYTGNNGLAINATLNGPLGIAVDTFGNLFIPDANNNVVREVNAASGIITTVAGNGTQGFGGDLGYALGANLNIPAGVAVDMYGTIYIADADNERVRKVYNPYLAVKNVSANATNITVFPNPSLGQVTVSGLQMSGKVYVYDLLGRQIGNGWDVPATGAQTFDVTSLVPGAYLLQINDANGNKMAVARLVKE